MKVARVQAMTAKTTSREKNKRPRLVSLTKNLGGMASLISFKDLQERNGYIERDLFENELERTMAWAYMQEVHLRYILYRMTYPLSNMQKKTKDESNGKFALTYSTRPSTF
jgi:hypothetical protein